MVIILGNVPPKTPPPPSLPLDRPSLLFLKDWSAYLCSSSCEPGHLPGPGPWIFPLSLVLLLPPAATPFPSLVLLVSAGSRSGREVNLGYYRCFKCMERNRAFTEAASRALRSLAWFFSCVFLSTNLNGFFHTCRKELRSRKVLPAFSSSDSKMSSRLHVHVVLNREENSRTSQRYKVVLCWVWLQETVVRKTVQFTGGGRAENYQAVPGRTPQGLR